MSYFDNLKTSDNISLKFSLFNFISLIILLISINIIYFFVWYEDQKGEGLYDMNVNYDSYTWNMSNDNIEAFKKYILTKDAIIIPNDWSDLICSPWVLKKVHEEVDQLKDKYFYKESDKIYFIFSRNYPQIWEVKVLFDTTDYIKSQIIIIKISLIIIFISLFLYYFIWKIVSKYALNDLKKISSKARELSIESNFEKIEIKWPADDEIRILAETINSSFKRIWDQTNNLKQFITDVSHEFKTPLMVINSRIDLYNKILEKWDYNKEDLEKLFKDLKLSTKKLDKLLETLFLFSRFQEWIVFFEKNRFNLSNFLKDISENIVSSFVDKKIDLSYKIKENIYKDIEDSTFNILLENLITNAIKFSWKAIKIEIWLNDKCFWVKDNWVWIKTKNFDKIWKKFYRNDLNKDGFGIWLFIVKRVCELYDWKPWIESDFWKWSKFIINF